ncbi:PRKC apoptosis WT1 regulator protein isoform X3 [Chrysemys picta bellii]|uniref:PRKC apoptosis WT1 regulator protein isoform X3 n=1 Tax=Chrysemys picta bellii TaxID=8478 RepID=UPI0032B1FE58
MASGGYRSSGGSTTDFLEEWKAKREKMRAKQAPPLPPGAPAGTDGKAPGSASSAAELNSTLHPAGLAAPPHPPERGAPSPSGGTNCVPLSARAGSKEPPPPAGGRAAEPAGKPPAAPGSPEEEKAVAKGKSSGPSARKGKGQIEKRKLREKRRSTGVVNIPAAEESSRTVSSRYKSATNAPEDDGPNRYSRTDRTGYSRYSRDANSSGNSVPGSALEKRIEELERELAKERQENVRLLRMTQDKEEQIGKLKEEIDLLNRDLDDIEDENEQLKQENKTLLKVVGQLTR